MNKKCIFLVLFLFIAGGLFAQEDSSGIKNWISGDVSLIGAGIRYERMLNDKFSIGGTAFFHSLFFFWNSLGINVTTRYYPWAGVFYAELGLGYGLNLEYGSYSTSTYTSNGYRSSSFGSRFYTNTGAMLNPGIGWRIDLGAPGGFYINPMISRRNKIRLWFWH